VLESKEYLVPKKWLDIVDSDPLPLLKLTLKSRSASNSNSLALTIIERKNCFAQRHMAESSASDDGMCSDFPTTGASYPKLPLKAESYLNNNLNEENPPPTVSTHALVTHLGAANRHNSKSTGDATSPAIQTLPLTSYTGAVVNFENDSNDLSRSDNDAQHSEEFDESYALTLVGSLESQQANHRRRIQALESHGLVVNDLCSVSKEPELFLLKNNIQNRDSEPNVWDYLVDDWELDKSNFSSGIETLQKNQGSQETATLIAGTQEKGKGSEVNRGFATSGVTVSYLHVLWAM
jgi:hypothetical protein